MIEQLHTDMGGGWNNVLVRYTRIIYFSFQWLQSGHAQGSSEGWEECLGWLKSDTDLTKEAAVKVELFKGKLDSRMVFNLTLSCCS